MSYINIFPSQYTDRGNILIIFSTVVNDESVIHTLQLLHPKLEAQLALAKQVTLLEALQELETHDSDSLNSLLPEYRKLLKNEKELQAQFKRQPAHLDRLYGNYMYEGKVKSSRPSLREIRDKQPLGRDPYRSWCQCHTTSMIKLYGHCQWFHGHWWQHTGKVKSSRPSLQPT